MRAWSQYGVLVLSLASLCLTDDTFVCCMGGWKEIHGTVLCSAPCCPGYEEKVERPPLLAPLVYCRKQGPELRSPMSKFHYFQ